MRLFLLLCLLLTSSCNSFPNIKAGEVHTSTSWTVGSSSFDATGIVITETEATASMVTWKYQFPGFSRSVVAKDVVIPQPK